MTFQNLLSCVIYESQALFVNTQRGPSSSLVESNNQCVSLIGVSILRLRCCELVLQVLTQICLALSALVLRAVEWSKPVEQLFASLSELQWQGTGSNGILELLRVLPEEVIEDQVVNASVDSSRRREFTQEVSLPVELAMFLNYVASTSQVCAWSFFSGI